MINDARRSSWLDNKNQRLQEELEFERRQRESAEADAVDLFERLRNAERKLDRMKPQMTRTNLACARHKRQKRAMLDERDQLRRQMLEGFAYLYHFCPEAVAKLCDEDLDKSGRLLGKVRKIAESAASNKMDQHVSVVEELLKEPSRGNGAGNGGLTFIPIKQSQAEGPSA